MASKDNTGFWLLAGVGTGFLLLGGLGSGMTEKLPKSKKKAVPGDSADKAKSKQLKPTEFFSKYYPFARQSEIATGVPALVTLAQAFVESGAGKHAPGFNFFGIKAGKTWTGKVQKLRTWECGKTSDPAASGVKDEVIAVYKPGDSKGNASCNSKGLYSYRVYGKFREYDSPAESFADHGNFLVKNTRYKKAFETRDARKFAKAIATAGYATAPNYADVLISIIDKAEKIISEAGISGRIAAAPLLVTFGDIEKNRFWRDAA